MIVTFFYARFIIFSFQKTIDSCLYTRLGFGDSPRFSLVGVVERTAGEGGRCFGLDDDDGEVPLVVLGLLDLGEFRARVDETVDDALLESDLQRAT